MKSSIVKIIVTLAFTGYCILHKKVGNVFLSDMLFKSEGQFYNVHKKTHRHKPVSCYST